MAIFKGVFDVYELYEQENYFDFCTSFCYTLLEFKAWVSMILTLKDLWRGFLNGFYKAFK
jgi:hypothetical protein